MSSVEMIDYSQEPELEHCPFCGSKDVELVMLFEGGEHFIIACQECGARSSPCITAAETVKRWNTRVPEKSITIDIDPKAVTDVMAKEKKKDKA